MEKFDDNTRKKLDLNPRQFYIILREDNEQYHKLYREIAEASENDEIRFCIIDTTIPGNPILEKTTDLYRELMSKDGEGNTWDFIIRDYPTNGKFSFSCWHRVSDDENDIKIDLNRWKKEKESEMWEKITRTFCGYFAKNTSTKSKIRAFYKTIDEILQSKGVPSARHENERDKLGCNLESYNGDESIKLIKLVKDFVGENMSKIDAFFNVKSREKSDEYMRCFFETGGYIARPKLKIVNTGNVYNGGVHDKYRLKVTTTSGRTEEVTFSSTNSFAMYIFYMTKVVRDEPIYIYKKDFYLSNNKNRETAKGNCEEYLAIYAAISGGIGGDPSTDITDDNIRIRRVIEGLKNLNDENDSFWRNANSMNTSFKEQLGEYEAEPFLIKTEEGEQRHRKYWLNFYYDDLDCEDDDLNHDICKYRKKIKKFKIFNSDNEKSLQSVH